MAFRHPAAANRSMTGRRVVPLALSFVLVVGATGGARLPAAKLDPNDSQPPWLEPLPGGEQPFEHIPITTWRLDEHHADFHYFNSAVAAASLHYWSVWHKDAVIRYADDIDNDERVADGHGHFFRWQMDHSRPNVPIFTKRHPQFRQLMACAC